MPDNIPHDPGSYGWVTYAWVLGLSAWGGLVRYLKEQPDRFRWIVLLRRLIGCTLAGLLTFWGCEMQEIHGLGAAILIAVSGYMGTEAIELFRKPPLKQKGE